MGFDANFVVMTGLWIADR